MGLSSLNVDVLLHLLKFVKPVDCFNLAISGILKGFENAHEGTDLHERIEGLDIELGLRRGGTCELEIRSLRFKCLPTGNLKSFKILEWLAEKGYLQNTQKFVSEFESDLLPTSSFVQIICTMKNLETFQTHAHYLTLEDFAHVFHSCTKLTELDIFATRLKMGKLCKALVYELDIFATVKMEEMGEVLVDQLRSGFQRLRCLHLKCSIVDDSWPVIQEMLTWLKECEQLTIHNQTYTGDEDLVTNGSLTLDPNFAKGLQIADFWDVPAVLVKWILSTCLNIHTLKLSDIPHSFRNELARLKKLKELKAFADSARALKLIVRSCRQLEILDVCIVFLTPEELAELEPAENLTDITLEWEIGPTIEEFLPILKILKRWQQLRRLTFSGSWETKLSVRPSPVEVYFEAKILSDFILGMEHLSYLQINLNYNNSSYGQLEILSDQVNKLILPLRPNFKFNISHSFVVTLRPNFKFNISHSFVPS